MADRLEQIREVPWGSGIDRGDAEWLLDEVDRLRASNERRLRLYRSMKSKHDRWAKQAADLRAEVDRLRSGIAAHKDIFVSPYAVDPMQASRNLWALIGDDDG